MMILLGLLLSLQVALAKEIALTFDDAPTTDTPHFTSAQRTKALIALLKKLDVPSAMIFANPCKSANAVEQLRTYVVAGHQVTNHTCTHPRLDEVGAPAYVTDIARAELLLAPLGQPKFFRYPYLNEGTTVERRDEVGAWLRKNGFRHGAVSVDNDDYVFAAKINQAKREGRKINYDRVRELYATYLLGAVEHYDQLARRTLGRSPKHVLLLHEVDSSVLFLEHFVARLRKAGWKIISAEEAFRDPLYLEQPRHLHAGSGVVAQVAAERTGVVHRYGNFVALKAQIDRAIGMFQK